jgi:anaerobic magnesium-protoporphyrin IX monomethyl ester cyclase
MSNVLITHSYFIQFDPKQWGLRQAYPPLGTLYAAAVLREAGHKVRFFDVTFAEKPEEILPVFEQEIPEILVICDDGFNYLTKMCLTNMREAAFQMAGWGNERGCRVIVSSSDAVDHVDDYLSHGAEFIIHGETEACLQQLVEALDSGQTDFSEIPGISYNAEGGAKTTRAREASKNLDLLPFPAWDLVDMERYRGIWMKRYGRFTINLTTTRGCPFRCTWCAKPLYGYRYNAHSPEYVVRQLLFLKQYVGFDNVWFCDDIFGLDKSWVATFVQLVKENNLNFRFKIQSRADLLLDENYVANLASAGCDTVWVGAESGSQKVLDAMNKGIQVAEIGQATDMLRKHGIHPAFFIQFGYPGEAMEDIRMTIQMINRLLPEDIGISVSYPLPGTIFYEMVKKDLTKKTNWTDSDDLSLMFKNTYPPEFYKRLHRYVHKNYRLHQGWACLTSSISHPSRFRPFMLRRIMLILYYIPTSLFARIRLNQRSHV